MDGNVRRFDCAGLRQLQCCTNTVTDEDLCGRNVLHYHPFNLLRDCSIHAPNNKYIHTVLNNNKYIHTVLNNNKYIHTVLNNNKYIHTVLNNNKYIHTVLNNNKYIHTVLNNNKYIHTVLNNNKYIHTVLNNNKYILYIHTYSDKQHEMKERRLSSKQ